MISLSEEDIGRSRINWLEDKQSPGGQAVGVAGIGVIELVAVCVFEGGIDMAVGGLAPRVAVDVGVFVWVVIDDVGAEVFAVVVLPAALSFVEVAKTAAGLHAAVNNRIKLVKIMISWRRGFMPGACLLVRRAFRESYPQFHLPGFQDRVFFPAWVRR